ncbi:MAG TPA: FecR domain-containing protein [Pedobacter sp.]
MDREIIKRYLRGECTPEERAEIKKLMLTGEAEALFDEVLNEGWSDEEEEEETDDARQLAEWREKFNQKVNQQEDTVKPRRNLSWINVAAVFAVFILSAGTYAWMYSKNKQIAALAVLRETVNPNGKLLKIKLGDSSTITLNAGSKLKYPGGFNGKTREVYLEGEAFFDVAHDPAHPFIVHTSKIIVSVLGTSFDIKSYKEDKKISVAVATGKVGVLAKGGKTYFLLPGEKLAYYAFSEIVQQTKADPAEVGMWQNGMLIYHDETLENISRQLERWYDVKVIFKRSEAAKMRFSLKQKNDRLENVMQTLKFAGGIRYVISGKTVTIW